MARYLDATIAAYWWEKMKAKFSAIGHTHSLSTATKKAVDTFTANVPTAVTLPTLTTSEISIPNVSVSTKSIPNVTSAGSAASASVSNYTLTITDGTAPTLGTAISVGSAILGTANTATGVGTWTAGSVTAGSAASLTTENVTILTSSTTGAATA